MKKHFDRLKKTKDMDGDLVIEPRSPEVR